LFVIRTAKRPWTSRPSAPLAITTLSVAGLGILLPYLPVAGLLGLEPLPAIYLPVLVVIVATYLTIVELIKASVLRRLMPWTQSP
jgi:Mg2+-importing ATPase